MSKRKDVAKTTSTRKSSTTLSKSTTKIREDSTERRKDEKVEIPIKNKTKHSSSTSVKHTLAQKDSKPSKPAPKTTLSSSNSSKNSEDMKLASTRNRSKTKVPVTPTSSRVSKTQFFPSKNMYSHALSTKHASTTKVTDSNSNKIKRDSLSTGETSIVKKTSSSQELSAGNMKRPVIKRGVTENKIISSSRKNPQKNIPLRKSTSFVKNITSDYTKPELEVAPISLESNKSAYTSPDSSTFSERPRTATLKRGSIVNANIVGPEAPKPRKSEKHLVGSKLLSPDSAMMDENVKSIPVSPKSEILEEYNYEEDFESYESDFEKYSSSSSSTNLDNISGEETSSVSTNSDSDTGAPKTLTSLPKKATSVANEEERKLDSGHFDMSDYKHKHILDNIKESVERENSTLIMMNNPASLSDEGFEDQKSLQFINFLDAKKKYERRKSSEIKERRGKEILSMIRLDSYSFTLFDLAPVPYEIFIKNYGTGNTVQTASQTGEDDVDEEIQTEDIVTRTKWTQIPISFSNGDQEDPNYWRNYKQEYVGVGGIDEPAEEKIRKPVFDEYSLHQFLISAGDLVIRIQEESKLNSTESVKKNPKPIPFSEGHILFDTSGMTFEGTTTKCASFSRDINSKVMTVHLRNSDIFGGGSVVAIWNICNSGSPETVYISYGTISCCSFGQNTSEFIFAGLEDGTLSVWKSMKNTTKQALLNNVPVYSTEIGFGHQSKIVALHPVGNDAREYFGETNSTNEICSLDENGEIILWTVIVKNSSELAPDEVVLVINATVSLQTVHPNLTDLQCTDFVISNINTNFAFISTNYGFIIQHLVKGGRTSVNKFLPETNSKANCVDTCPFMPDYFFAGFDNGDINLYSRMIETPLMVLSDKGSKIDECSVELIQWSKNKPFVIYTKDKRNTIHVWDLSESDMVPIYSIPFDKEITCMKLSPSVRYREREKSYMIIGTKDGSLFLHLLNEEHGQQSNQIFDEHVRTFLNYVNRL